jgi:hypothetical protein
MGIAHTTKQYVDGAFSCYLCHKSFNYEIKTTKGNLIELHTQAHIARFFNDIFGRADIRSAFYNYHARVITLATFQQMEDVLLK